MIIRAAAKAGQGLLKIYELDPLICSICGANMRIIAFIDDYKVIRKILDYLGIYEFKRDKPRQNLWQLQTHFMTMHKTII